MTDARLTRRTLLGATAAAGGVVLAPSLMAADTGRLRPRLVVMIARGGLDGLSFAPPVGEPRYEALRGAIAIAPSALHGFDTDFGLHPKLKTLATLARAGRMRLAPAAALWTPDRSHFRAQDLLETGTPDTAEESGWLRRAAALLFPGGVSTVAVGPAPPLVLQGATTTQNWSADQPPLDPFSQDALAALYRGDRLRGAVANLGELSRIADQSTPGRSPDPDSAVRAAETAAKLLAAPHGASIAVLSFYGFDTHYAQGGVSGALGTSLGVLDRAVARLQSGLGPAWSTTVVMIITEFGRTAAVNGVGGTDHGTASTAVLAGGAVKSGGLLGDWPGLAASALFESRDLRPGLDLRALFKGVLMEHFGLDRAVLARHVFPNTTDIAPLQGLVRSVDRPALAQT